MYPIQIERYAHLPMYGFKMREREKKSKKKTDAYRIFNKFNLWHTHFGPLGIETTRETADSMNRAENKTKTKNYRLKVIQGQIDWFDFRLTFNRNQF